MFNGTKQTFGAPANTGFGYNNPAAASPFGVQNTFGKPATAGFGQPAAFGQPTSLFGATQPTTNFFGSSTAQTPAFGAPATTQSSFGTSLSGFGQPQQQAPLFGATAQPNQPNTLFAQSFGAAKPAGFGFGQTQPTTSLFGQASTAPAPGTAFGGFGATTTAGAPGGGGGLFGATATPAFGQQQQQQQQVQPGASGSAMIKYQPSVGTDTLVKNGATNNVNTKQHCITAMKEYEAKSLEELRIEDYLSNRKGSQTGMAPSAGGMFGGNVPGTTSIFGAPASQPSTGLFGQPTQPATNTLSGGGFGAANNSLTGFGQQQSAFGQQNPQQQQQQQQQGLFGKTFGGTPTVATSQAPFGGFSATPAQQQNTGGGLFGAKPFGQAVQPTGGGLFGQPNAVSTSVAPAFGAQQPATGGFGSFGQTSINQPAPLFGAASTAVANTGGFGGLGTATAGSAFGGFNNPSSTANTGGLFGQKPATGFGTGSAFGATTSAAPAFGSFGQQNQGGSLFNNSFNKPAAPTFSGFGATATAPTLGGGLGLGQAPGTSLFGNTVNKPGGLFGTAPAPAPGGMFGSSFGASNPLGGNTFGQNTLGMGQNMINPQPPSIPIHQQILALATSPYGDNPIFKDLKPLSGVGSDEALKPTNPAAQKAILESSSNQFKISTKLNSGSAIKVKPVSASFSKKSLFGGLEEFDSSIEETFSLKPNAKRLLIKPKVTQSPSSGGAVNQQMLSPAHQHGRTSVTDSSSKRLYLPKQPLQQQQQQQQSPLRKVDQQQQQQGEDVVGESFNNQIPASAPPTTIGQPLDENTRRESWLHSNALKKVTKQNNYSNEFHHLDNTIHELVTSAGKDDHLKFSESINLTTSPSDESILVPIRQSAPINANTSADSSISRSFLDETNPDLSLINVEVNSTGVILHRAGYYTIPSIDKLVDYLAPDGSCKVPNFTIGRRGYGNVYFDVEIDVAGLNLDELVHFRHKEVIIYPDDENKPPVGQGLNRKAQITLDQVWPHHKTLREPIKDRDTLEQMDYEAKLRRVCDKHDMRFIDYRPETGSWVFKVDHFSKYGLSDSDEEDVPIDPKKAKLTQLKAGEMLTGTIPKNLQSDLNKSTTATLISTQQQQQQKMNQGLGGFDVRLENENEFSMDFNNTKQNIMLSDGTNGYSSALSPSAAVALEMGTDSHKLQLMKASFFIDDEFDGKSVISEQTGGRDSPDQIVPHRPYLRNLFPGIGSGGGGFSMGLLTTTQQRFGSGGEGSTISSNFNVPHGIGGILSTMPYKNVVGSTAKSGYDSLKLIQPIGPKSRPLIVKPKVALMKIPRTVIPMDNSSLSEVLNVNCAADMAFYHGRKFKCGWGPQNSLFLLTSFDNVKHIQPKEYNIGGEIAQLFNGRRRNDFSRSVLVNLQISSTKQIPSFQESIENHLNNQLKNCQKIATTATGVNDEDIDIDDGMDGCPYLKSGGGTNALVEHLYLAKENIKFGEYEEFLVTVWSLCVALWSDQVELDGLDANNHLTVIRRRELLSDWLEQVVYEKNETFSQQKQHTDMESGYLETLLNLLSCHKVEDACELAFNNNDINLSFLLAQLSGGPTVRQLIQHQIASWQDVEADKFIRIERLKAYMLIAGIPLVSSSHGTINIYEDLGWLKSLALNVWYLSSATASLTDALLTYEDSFKSNEFYAQNPIPPYAAIYQATTSSTIEDIRYHILKLYSKRSHPMETLLNPATHTPDPMDYRLSWLLLQSFEAIGYHHSSKLSRAQIHTSFANQLENHGMWHWSIFVLLHLDDRQQRELSIQNLLYKYIQLNCGDTNTIDNNMDCGGGAGDNNGGGGNGNSENDDDDDDAGTSTAATDDDYREKENFIITELCIPKKWIYWAKSVRASSMNKFHAQANYLLKAKQWAMAHDIIMTNIAPDAVINDNISYVRGLLNRLEDTRQIPNWSNQGSILLDYIEISEKFEKLKNIAEKDVESSWEQLKPQLSELCSRINLFPCPTAKHRLCQCEIAQRLANLVIGVRILCPELNSCILMKVVLEKLPLPQEYAKQKFRTLLEDDRLLDELVERMYTD